MQRYTQITDCLYVEGIKGNYKLRIQTERDIVIPNFILCHILEQKKYMKISLPAWDLLCRLLHKKFYSAKYTWDVKYT